LGEALPDAYVVRRGETVAVALTIGVHRFHLALNWVPDGEYMWAVELAGGSYRHVMPDEGIQYELGLALDALITQASKLLPPSVGCRAFGKPPASSR
jgi:hypothetical protein